jgi:hypothetical protein
MSSLHQHTVLQSRINASVRALDSLQTTTNTILTDISNNGLVTFHTGQGVHGNLFDSCITLADQKSKVYDARNVSYVDVFGYVDTSSILSFQLSQDNTNFYNAAYRWPLTDGCGGGGGSGHGGAGTSVTPDWGDFHIGFDIGANYLRMSCDTSGAFITATAAGK